VSRVQCPFCNIADGTDRQALLVYEDADTMAFTPLNPATRGHTLVIPRTHRQYLWELTAVEAESTARTVRRVSAAVVRALRPDGLNVIQSNGEVATQTVPHVHFHVVPRYKRDRMTLRWPRGAAEAIGDQRETVSLLSHALSAEDSLESRPDTAQPRIVSPEDRRQHLSFIQSVITRMSQASSSSKTWLLPIVTASYGYAVVKGSPSVAAFGIISVAIFGILDANYLKQERAFRRLYAKVAAGHPIPAFDMNPALAAPARDSALGTGPGKVDYWPNWEDVKSWAIAPVYLPLLAVGVVIAATSVS